MRKPTDWLLSFDRDMIDPLHILNIKHRDILKVFLILKIRRAEISSEEDQQHLIYHTRLLLFLAWVLPLNARHCCPFLLRNIKGIIILQKRGIVPTIDDDLIPVGH